MAKRQIPLIVESALTRPSRWFVLTRYQEKKGVNPETGAAVSYLRALVKHDVTDQMRAILKQRTKTPKGRRGKAICDVSPS